ncbi:hypothetical protein BH11MYX2_BH11MYX2_31600 [soil metagenome]
MIVALVAALLCATASATPQQDLDKGRSSFRARDWGQTILVLNLLLYPGPNRVPQLSQVNDLIEAHVMLGVSLFESGDRTRAHEELDSALQLDPDRSISALSYSEGVVRMFEEIKTERVARARRDEDLKRIAEARAQLEAYKKSLVVYEARPYYWNFFPLGLAQVTQHRYTAGALLGAGQMATLGASAGIYFYLVRKYGFTGTVPLEDGHFVRRLQQIEIGTGIAFIGLYAIGVYDALRHYKPRQRIEGDDSLIPEELREKQGPKPERKTKKVSLFDRLSVAPMVSDSSVGLGIGWEN